MTDYATLRLDTERRLARVTLVLLLVPTLWFVRSDLAVSGESDALLRTRLSIRALIIATCLWAVWRLRPRMTRAELTRTLTVLGITTALLIISLNSMRPAGSVLPLRTPLLWIAAYYAVLSTDPRRHIVAPLIISAGIIVLRAWRVRTGNDLLGDVMVLLVFNALGLALVWHRDGLARAAEAAFQAERQARDDARHALDELQALRGILPICANCRKVRVERGTWEALEAYVHHHTTVKFSHGICPDCAKVLYPDASATSEG